MKIFLHHILFFITFTALFIISLRLEVLNEMVLFYRGIILITLISILIGVILWFLKSRWLRDILGFKDIVMAIILFSCVNMVFFTIFPVSIERSISVFIIDYFSESNRVVTKDELDQDFLEKYVEERSAIQKRLDEQIITGNIKRSGSGYIITDQGVRMKATFDFVAKIVGLHRLSCNVPKCVKK